MSGTGLESRAGQAALALVEGLAARSMTVAFAESCTGGLLSSMVTDIPGASKVFWGGVVSYTESAKTGLLGVAPCIIGNHGVVSRETALAMAAGILGKSGADLAVAVTGWAGPEAPAGEGGPGRVCIAWSSRAGRSGSIESRFMGGRREVRLAAALCALEGALDLLAGKELPEARY